MIVVLGACLGAAIGVLLARRRRGTLADRLQYAAVFAIIFALAALFVTVAIQRLSV